jgi:hypothetical protein
MKIKEPPLVLILVWKPPKKHQFSQKNWVKNHQLWKQFIWCFSKIYENCNTYKTTRVLFYVWEPWLWALSIMSL